MPGPGGQRRVLMHRDEHWGGSRWSNGLRVLLGQGGGSVEGEWVRRSLWGSGVKLSVTYHMTPGLAMPPLELGVALVAAIVGAQVRGPVKVGGQGRLDSLRHGGW